MSERLTKADIISIGDDSTIDARSRALLHEHLQNVLEELNTPDLERYVKRRPKVPGQIPSNLLVHYVASKFVLAWNWWIDSNSPLTPTEIRDLFRALVLATLVTSLES